MIEHALRITPVPETVLSDGRFGADCDHLRVPTPGLYNPETGRDYCVWSPSPSSVVVTLRVTATHLIIHLRTTIAENYVLEIPSVLQTLPQFEVDQLRLGESTRTGNPQVPFNEAWGVLGIVILVTLNLPQSRTAVSHHPCPTPSTDPEIGL